MLLDKTRFKNTEGNLLFYSTKQKLGQVYRLSSTTDKQENRENASRTSKQQIPKHGQLIRKATKTET